MNPDSINKSLVFMREIVNIEKYAIEDIELTSDYIDINHKNQTIDFDSKSLLNDLKSKIESYLPENNIHKIKVCFSSYKRVLHFIF